MIQQSTIHTATKQQYNIGLLLFVIELKFKRRLHETINKQITIIYYDLFICFVVVVIEYIYYIILIIINLYIGL